MRTPIATRLARAAASLFAAVLMIGTVVPSQAAQDTAAEQRKRFIEARLALQQQDHDAFQRHAKALRDYPLYPYLRYWQLSEDPAQADEATMLAFLDEYRSTPLSAPLRHLWLRALAQSQQWQTFLDNYHGARSAELRCHAAHARLAVGDEGQAWADAKKLWLVGTSQHAACDPLFDAWEEAGGLTDALRSQRIKLAMERGNSGLVRYLNKSLPTELQAPAERWLAIHNEPTRIADEKLLPGGSAEQAAIVLHGFKRLAASDPEQAAALWPALSLRHEFSEQQRHQAQLAVALALALDGNISALEWYAALPAEALNQTHRAWAVRAALRNKRWLAAIAWIEAMPAAERESEMWSYWLARAHEARGNGEQAQRLYRRVSSGRSYYGFLAADRIGTDYNLHHAPLQIDAKQLKSLRRLAGVKRARELYYLGMLEEARQEWEYAVARMDRKQRKAAGILADRWQWHDRALLTLARANHFDDLRIRFPLAYSDTIADAAKQRALDPAWIYAVARQESAMDPSARSPVGAMGLMQLMPATGRSVARKLQHPLEDRQQLLEPSTNIRFGSYYLSEVLQRFDGNPILATAAYNAGPHRVERWFPGASAMAADIWIDTMPFHETRSYVRRVLAYSVFYDQRLERPIRRLSQRMPEIASPPALNPDMGPALSQCSDCNAPADEEG